MCDIVAMNLSKEHMLSPTDIEAYQRDGHVAIRSLTTAEEIATIRPITDGLVREATVDVAPLGERDTFGKAFLQVTDLHKRNPQVRAFVHGHRFAKVAAELMGVAAVRLFFDQALFKEPGGGFTPWHQDHIYWPIDTENMITLWLPLIDIPVEVGSLEFVSGSHRSEYRDYIVISDESEEKYRRLVDEAGLRVGSHGSMRIGDATFHAGWTLHRAPGNPAMTTREVFTIVYFEDGAPVVSEVHPPQRPDFENYFGSMEPGDVITSESTPLLYRTEG